MSDVRFELFYITIRQNEKLPLVLEEQGDLKNN